MPLGVAVASLGCGGIPWEGRGFSSEDRSARRSSPRGAPACGWGAARALGSCPRARAAFGGRLHSWGRGLFCGNPELDPFGRRFGRFQFKDSVSSAAPASASSIVGIPSAASAAANSASSAAISASVGSAISPSDASNVSASTVSASATAAAPLWAPLCVPSSVSATVAGWRARSSCRPLFLAFSGSPTWASTRPNRRSPTRESVCVLEERLDLEDLEIVERRIDAQLPVEPEFFELLHQGNTFHVVFLGERGNALFRH